MEKSFFKEEVDRISRLAYLHLNKDERKEMIEHFEKMYKLVSKLKEVDTENVPMLIYPHEDMQLKLHEDSPLEGLDPIDVIKNAPDSFKEYIKTRSPIKQAKIKEK